MSTQYMNDQDITALYENLPDNSHKARAEAQQAQQLQQKQPSDGKRVEKVVKGKVKTKKNEMRRLADIFISEDVANIKDYILLDVLAPAIKKALYDIVVGSLDTTLFGSRGNGGKRTTADKISYKDYSSISKRDDRGNDRPRTASGYSYDDIVFETRGAAEAVLDRMYELIEEYGNVRVADMYDMAGITGNYTDNRYGWNDLRGTKIERTYQGYVIRMPRATVLK